MCCEICFLTFFTRALVWLDNQGWRRRGAVRHSARRMSYFVISFFTIAFNSFCVLAFGYGGFFSGGHSILPGIIDSRLYRVVRQAGRDNIANRRFHIHDVWRKESAANVFINKGRKGERNEENCIYSSWSSGVRCNQLGRPSLCCHHAKSHSRRLGCGWLGGGTEHQCTQ